ncbi:helix-turn-helix domain-containing protein [Flavobacteriaceae bacterium W22]|nr:helix-turn-helix domain-containing protein [Flavobacteriaceae bacterium W22]
MANKGLQKLRINNKLTQTQLAEKLGVSRSTIAKIENGKLTLTVKMIENIKFHFNIELHYTNNYMEDYSIIFLKKTGKYSIYQIPETAV